MTAPAWMLKHPCTGCDTGYGMCAQYALTDLRCCPHCNHPTRWTADPYTTEELAEMWNGHENVPEAVRRKLASTPPPDPLAYTIHDDYDDEPPELPHQPYEDSFNDKDDDP